jgi:aspartyl-tRNA(Asn)/glutamyl-tRNA(Gln) amidotransferase subunit B
MTTLYLITIEVLTADRDISIYYESILTLLDGSDLKKSAKSAANWLTGAVFSIANDNKIDINNDNIPIKALAILIKEFDSKTLIRNKAEELLRESLVNKLDLEELINKAKDEAKESTSNMDSIVDEVLSNNPKAVEDYKAGKQASLGFLLGQVMQKTKGSADPNSATKSILIEKLNG